MSANSQSESCWRKLARERWPGKDIFGDGYFAVLFCGGTISLTDNREWAEASVKHACFPELKCRGKHLAFDLRKPAPAPKPQQAFPSLEHFHFGESAADERRWEARYAK